jgi:5'-nucleotidase
MKILVTNDDGFNCPFLKLLCSQISKKHDIRVVAPAHEQSAIGQAITLNHSLRYRELDSYDFPACQVFGTPSDCVKFAVVHLFKDLKFDLVISGINPCENAGLSTLYSGTVAGAREAAAWGIPAVALSVWDDSRDKAEYAADWIAGLLDKPDLFDFSPGVFWSVNFPNCEPARVSGIRITNMSPAMFKDRYVEYKTPKGHPEFWLTGEKCREQYTDGSDDLALSENMIALTPLQIDQTSEEEKRRLERLQAEITLPKVVTGHL